MTWHTLTAADALEKLESRAEGLTADEAAARRARYGPNALAVARPTPAWRILIGQLRSVIVWLLVVAAAIAYASRDTPDAIAIVAVLAINVALGFTTELRGRRAMEALRSLVVARALVRRDGTVREIDASELVPGDITLLTAGDSVPADARLIDATELSATEATLTGESAPVEKQADAVLPDNTSLPDRVNLVFQGTSIVAGRARALVIATGNRTELGRIGTLVGGIAEERTPLERRLDLLGRRLAVAALGIAIVIALIELLRSVPLSRVLQTGIAVAVAAVPEGLPVIVTVAMAIGVHRMARRRALVRRLPSIETLGSTTVIATDKTGTLTSGEMTLTAIAVGGTEWRADTGAERGFRPANETAEADARLLHRALRIAALANRLPEQRDGEDAKPHEHPEERALLNAAHEAGLDRSALLAEAPEVAELPFSSARMLMATFHRTAGGLVAFVKGAPGRVLERCERVLSATGEAVALDDRTRAALRDQNDRLAADGLRVLALAEGVVPAPDEHSLHGLTFIGFAGLIDPAAPGVPETITRLRAAGIRIVMLTGDQLATARAIARELGILDAGGESLAGSDIDRLSDEELIERAPRLVVCSRVSPEAKLRIVTALQRRGDIVAMLGDGVNDAAALKKADIGVAMGRRGTDAAREAAGVVLADDRFETIAVAVEEGRAIFDNIRRFVFYLFSCNLGELFLLLAAGVAGLPLPLLPLHLLWLNIVTDTLPALALAFEPVEADVMKNPPRDPRAQIMSRAFAVSTIRFGFMIGGVSLLAFVWALRAFPGDAAMAMTLAFMTLGFAQLFHLGNARSRLPVLAPHRVTANVFALGAVVVGIGLQVAAVAVPPLARVLDLRPLAAREWLAVIALGAVPALAGQLGRLIRRGASGPSATPVRA